MPTCDLRGQGTGVAWQVFVSGAQPRKHLGSLIGRLASLVSLWEIEDDGEGLASLCENGCADVAPHVLDSTR